MLLIGIIFNNQKVISFIMNTLPGRKKILVYLHGIGEHSGNRIYPFSFCQEEIAQNVELSQNRVSKLLLEMKENGLIESKSKRVKGALNKRYIYILTSEGEKKAEKIKRDIGEENIHVKTESAVTEIKLKDIGNYVQGSNSYLFALNNLDPNGILDLTDIGDEETFLNREEKIELLRRYIRKRKDRSYNTLLIKGCAGVGKTRLVKEFKKELRDEDIDFYEGRGSYDSFQPFFPFRKIFSDILEERLETAEGVDWKNEFEDLDISSESFFNRTKSLLEHLSSEGPLIIFVDNLQWIDSISLRFLEYLTHELDENRVCIVVAYRDEEMDNPFSGKSIEGLVDSNDSKTVEVKPFDWINTRKLLITTIGRNDILDEFVDMIYDQTDGIPLFIKALTDEMLKENTIQPLKEKYPKTSEKMKLPDKVKELYDLKFRDLNQKEKEILQLCSCMEDSFLEDLVISSSSCEKDETKKIIDNLKRAKFLKDASKGKLRFTYEMTRFATYKGLSRSRKKSLHKIIADNLKKIDEEKGVDYHLRLGKHLEKIERYNEAARSYLKGGNKAKEIYENEKALLLYERALKVLKEHPVKGIDESKIHEYLAEIFKRKKDHRRALDHLKEAKRITKDEKSLLCLNRKIAGCLRETNQYDDASEYIEKGEEMLSKMKELSFEDEKERCKLLKEKGMVCLRKNEFEDCQNIFQEMKELSDKIDSKEDKAEAIHYLGTLAYYRSDFDQAKKYLQRSIEIRKKTDDLKGLAKSYNNLGVVFRNLQKPYRALEFYEKSNEVKKELGSKEGGLSALENIGIIYYDIGELDKSIEYYQKCLKIEKEIEDEHGMAATLDNIGVSYFGKGEFDKALEYHEQSLELKKRLEDRSGISFSLYNMGLAYRGKSEFEKALDFLEESLEIRRELEDKLNIGYSKLWIGVVYLDVKNLDKADEYLKNALDIFKETKSDHGMGITLVYLGRLNVLRNSLEEAKRYLEHSEKIKSKLEEEGFKLILDRHFAEFYLKKNRLEKSRAHCQESLKRAKKTDMKNQIGKCRKVLGKIYCEIELFDRGEKEFQKAMKIFNETGDKKNKAEVMFEWGTRLIEQGEEEKGDEKRSEALKLFEESKIDISSYEPQ